MITQTLPPLRLEDGNLDLLDCDLVVLSGFVKEIIVDKWRVLGGVAILQARSSFSDKSLAFGFKTNLIVSVRR